MISEDIDQEMYYKKLKEKDDLKAFPFLHNLNLLISHHNLIARDMGEEAQELIESWNDNIELEKSWHEMRQLERDTLNKISMLLQVLEKPKEPTSER